MSILELVREHKKKEIFERGFREGVREGIEFYFKIIQLHRKGKTVKEIATELEIKISKIKKVLKDLP